MRHLFAIAFITSSFVCAVTASAQQFQNEPHSVLTFLSHRSGHNRLYRSYPDGTNPQPIFGGPITDVPSFNESYTRFWEPHWTRQSPNGKYFASWVYETGEPYSAYQGVARPMLWVGDIGGTWTRIVNPDCTEEFAWSPDSKQLAFSILSTDHYRGSLQNRPTATEICISGIDGSDFSCVLEQNGKWFVLDWSPDGTRLLVERRDFGQKAEDLTTELFEFRLADAIAARKRDKKDFDAEWIVNDAPKFLNRIELNLDGMHFSEARYSPTRNELAILIYDRKNMYAPNLVADDELGRGRMMRLLGKIHLFDLDNKTSRKVADFDDGMRGPICWSPDGDEILFSRYLPKDDDREKLSAAKEHGLAIWSVGRDGSNARFVTTGWSPDCPRNESGNGK
jgi:hypothetical protein